MKIGLFCILFSFIALSIGSALNESLTYDEVFYLEEGRRIVATRTFSDPYNPPLAPMLTAIPKVGRLVTVGLGILLVLAVYRVGGPVAALFLAFDPTLLAHSHYGTSDVAVTLFIFLSTIAWIRFMKNPSRWRALLLGLAAGYSLASKMTAIPYLTVTFAVCWWWKRSRRRWTWFVRHGLMLLASATVALFVLWASYLFTWDVLIREREDPSRVSARLVAYAKEHNLPALESIMTFLTRQPLPLGTYAATIKNNILRAGKPSMVFFDGAIYDRSRWYFMIINVFRKLPLPFFILVIIGAWYNRRFATIGVGIVVAASFMGMVPLDRYVLPAIPFFALVAASGLRKKILVLFLLWQIVGTIWQYPHFISYANELAGPHEKRYEILSDSNLDWGQALPDVARYAKREKLGKVKFSYFGRDDAAAYDLASTTPYGSWKFDEICAFHDVILDPKSNKESTVISVSNWYYCGYNKEEAFRKEHIWNIVADTLLVF